MDSNNITPTTPQPFNSVTPVGPAKPKAKSKVGLIVGVVVAVVLVTAAAVAFIMINSVSKKDYADAKDQAQQMADAVSSDSDVFSAAQSFMNKADDGSVTADDLDKVEQKIKSTRSTLKEHADKLATMKAIQHDKDAKTKYDTLKKAYDDYDKLLALGEELYGEKGLRPVLVAVNDMSSAMASINSGNSSDYKAVYQQIASSIEEAATAIKNTDISDKDINEAMHNMGDVYQSLADIFNKLANVFTSGDYSAFTSLEAEYKDIDAKGKTATDNFTKAIENKFGTTDKPSDAEQKFSDAVSDLDKYLADKSND